MLTEQNDNNDFQESGLKPILFVKGNFNLYQAISPFT